MNRKKYTPEFKAKVLAPVLAGTKKQSEVVKEHGLTSSMVSTWMNAAREAAKGSQKPKATRTAKGETHGAIALLRKAEREIMRRGARLEQSDLLLILALRMLEGES